MADQGDNAQYVADCRTCGYHEEFKIATLANEAAREHRARSVMPSRKAHDVVSMPKDVFEEGSHLLKMAAASEELAARIRLMPAHTETATGAFPNWTAFYGGLGFRLTPVRAPCAACVTGQTRDPSRCKACRGGKRPLYEGWQNGVPLEVDHNVGIVTGAASGNLVVIDFDEPDLVRKLLGMTPERLADVTLVVRTARGHHVYLRQGGVPNMKLVGGVDVRGDGGMVVAPPSQNARGRQYEFVQGASIALRHVAPAARVLPPDLLRRLTAPPLTGAHANTRNTEQHAGGGGGPNDESAPAGTEAHGLEVEPFPLDAVEEYVEMQSATLRAHWRILQGKSEPLPPTMGGRSKSDWVLGLCLAEMGLNPGQIAGVLLQLRGSKAAERGAGYALHTAGRAWATKRRRLPRSAW